MNTEEIIAVDIEDIESARAPLADELGVAPDSPAVDTGIQTLARDIIHDLNRCLVRYQEAGIGQGRQDLYAARIFAIRKRFLS